MCINITRLIETVESHALALDSDMTWIVYVNNRHLSPYKSVLMGFVKSNSNSKMVWKSIIDLEGIESPALESDMAWIIVIGGRHPSPQKLIFARNTDT